MIKSLSPFYLTIPFINPATSLACSSYKIVLYVWNGSKNQALTNPTYEVTKNNPTTSIGNDTVDISRLVNDFIQFTPQQSTGVSLIDGNNQYWVKYHIEYNSNTTKRYETTQLLLRGYGYGMEGANTQPPTNKILITGTEFKVSRNGVFNLPILIDERNEISGAITITSTPINSSTSTSQNININFTITGFSPANVDLQKSESGLSVWTTQQTYTNSSPINNVTITHPSGGDADIRLIFTIGANVYVSNIVNIGQV